MWIPAFSFIFNFVMFYTAHSQPTSYYICNATMPELNLSLPSHIGGKHVEIFTILTIIVAKLKIHYFRSREVERAMTQRSIFLKNFSLEVINKSSITSFTTNLAGLLIISLSTFIGIKFSELKPQEMNEYPNYLYVYFIHLILPNLAGVVFVALFYSKNSPMRESILSELKSGFECLF